MYEWGRPDHTDSTIVLVHGYPDTAAVWTPVAVCLAERHHVVAYDVRGAGRSTRPRATAAYALPNLMADMAAVIDATCPDRRVHLAGHDWGSLQGWEAVSTDSLAGRIATYTSMSGPCVDDVGLWLRRLLRNRTLASVREVMVQAVRSWYIGAFLLPGATLGWRVVGARAFPKVVTRLDGVQPDAEWPATTLARDGAAGVRLYRANVPSRLRRPRPRRVDIPVQVILPTGDRFISPALYDDLDEWVPDLRVRRPAGGHWLLRTHPEAVAGWISEHALTAQAARR